MCVCVRACVRVSARVRACMRACVFGVCVFVSIVMMHLLFSSLNGVHREVVHVDTFQFRPDLSQFGTLVQRRFGMAPNLVPFYYIVPQRPLHYAFTHMRQSEWGVMCRSCQQCDSTCEMLDVTRDMKYWSKKENNTLHALTSHTQATKCQLY